MPEKPCFFDKFIILISLFVQVLLVIIWKFHKMSWRFPLLWKYAEKEKRWTFAYFKTLSSW